MLGSELSAGPPWNAQTERRVKPQPLLESISVQRHPPPRRRPDPDGGQRIPGLSKLWPEGEKQTFFSSQPPSSEISTGRYTTRSPGVLRKKKCHSLPRSLARSLISAVLFWFPQIFPKGCEEQLLYICRPRWDGGGG